MGLVRVWGSVSGPNRAWGILYNDASEGSREIALPVVEASIFKSLRVHAGFRAELSSFGALGVKISVTLECGVLGLERRGVFRDSKHAKGFGPAFGNLSHYRLLDSLYPLQGTCTHLMLAALFPKSDYE